MVRANRVGGSVPSYTHCLSCIGQYLNQQRARMVTVAEVDSGYMVFFYPAADFTKQRILIVPFADLIDLNGEFAPAARGRKGGILRDGLRHDKRHSLFPQGYAAVFKALGTRFDQRGATGVTICESGSTLYVEYWVDNATFVVRDQRRQAISHHQFDRYDAAGLQRIQEAVRLAREQEVGRHMAALRLNRHDFISAMQAALLDEDEGNYAGAEDVFARITAQVPEHAEAQYHLARLAYIRGDKQLALRAIRKALVLRPDIGAVQDLYGRILLQHRRLAEAIAAFEAAVSQAPEMLVHPYHLAKAYQAQGRTADAEAMMALVSPAHAAPAWDALEAQLSEQPQPTPVPGMAPEPSEEGAPDRSAETLAASIDQDQEEPLATPALTAHAEPPLASPTLTTTFDLVEPLTWAQPERQLPTLDAASVAEAEAARNGDKPSAIPQAPLQTLSQRLQTTRAPGTGSLAARVPPPPTETAAESQDLPHLPAEALPPLSPSPFGTASSADALPRLSLDALPSLPPSTPSRMTPLRDAAPPKEAPQAPLGNEPASLSSGTAARSGQESGSSEIPREGQGTVEIVAEIMLIQRALEVEPTRADLHRKLGFLLARQGRAAEAAAAFRQALECSRMSL
jgi:tetratricopeptide (TPR) repeat protein